MRFEKKIKEMSVVVNRLFCVTTDGELYTKFYANPKVQDAEWSKIDGPIDEKKLQEQLRVEEALRQHESSAV